MENNNESLNNIITNEDRAVLEDISTSGSSTITPELEEELDRIVEEAHQESNPSLINPNSETLLIDDTVSRFSSASWFENVQTKVITLAGVGGIGSHTVFMLSRLKPRALFIYDPDTVELANMSGQLYSINDCGSYKVNAISNMITLYSDYNSCFAINTRFNSDTEASDIMICGFDNMDARKLFFQKWKLHTSQFIDKKKCLFIDGRLNAEEFQIFCIRGDDTYNILRYEKEFLFDDSEIDDTICSYKQTSFCASMIASFITNLFVNFCAIEVGIYRDLPFLTYYNAETMYIKTEA